MLQPPNSAVLTTDMELLTVALTQRTVAIWTRTADDIYVLLEEEGSIEKFSAEELTISGRTYLRDECEIYVQAERRKPDLDEPPDESPSVER